MADLNAMVDRLSALSLTDCGELATMLETKWGVSARPQTAQVLQEGPVVDAVIEQTEFDAILAECGDSVRIQVVRELRPILGLGLKESMDFAKAVPQVIKTGIGRDAAEAIKVKIEAVGGKVEIK